MTQEYSIRYIDTDKADALLCIWAAQGWRVHTIHLKPTKPEYSTGRQYRRVLLVRKVGVLRRLKTYVKSVLRRR